MLDEAEQRGVRGQESNSDSRAEAEHPPVAHFPRIELEHSSTSESDRTRSRGRLSSLAWRSIVSTAMGFRDPARLFCDFARPALCLSTSTPVTSTLSCLRGSQRDANGAAEAGTLMINPPGTRHRIVSEAGCIVLAIYERPVRFLEPSPVA